jgi:hypothetical protein
MNAANESAEVRKARLDRAFKLRDERLERERRGPAGSATWRREEEGQAILAAMVTFLLAPMFGQHGRITEAQVQSAIEGSRLILKTIAETERRAGSKVQPPRA